MIGKLVTFITQEIKEGLPAAKNHQYTGRVVDKFRSHEKIVVTAGEVEFIPVDKYLVEFEGGVLGVFYCDEAKRIEFGKEEMHSVPQIIY